MHDLVSQPTNHYSRETSSPTYIDRPIDVGTEANFYVCNRRTNLIGRRTASIYGSCSGDNGEGGAGGRRADAILQHDRHGKTVAGNAGGSGRRGRRR